MRERARPHRAHTQGPRQSARQGAQRASGPRQPRVERIWHGWHPRAGLQGKGSSTPRRGGKARGCAGGRASGRAGGTCWSWQGWSAPTSRHGYAAIAWGGPARDAAGDSSLPRASRHGLRNAAIAGSAAAAGVRRGRLFGLPWEGWRPSRSVAQRYRSASLRHANRRHDAGAATVSAVPRLSRSAACGVSTADGRRSWWRLRLPHHGAAELPSGQRRSRRERPHRARRPPRRANARDASDASLGRWYLCCASSHGCPAAATGRQGDATSPRQAALA
mmetsp:Transcript_97992/g.277147  ORF Transcript_97992/g.277147 Transcript_97992/m.277147 type:complete len:276 (-) Transcript_97992:175-1002(-)